MSGFIRFKHWGPTGDLLSCLPGIKKVCQDTGGKAIIMQRLNVLPIYYEGAIPATFDEKGNAVAMSAGQWEMLVPLLNKQDFIDHVEVWEGQKFDVDLDVIRETRTTPMPHGDLYFWQQLVYFQMATDFSKPWLDVSVIGFDHMAAISEGSIIINLTERYRNQLVTYYFLKEYESKLIFAGTENEHKIFCESYNLTIPRLLVNNFLELGQAIKACKFFLGNQSMCYHIAEGLGKKRLLEICPAVANVWPHTPDGFPYMQQPLLEMYFKMFMDEAS